MAFATKPQLAGDMIGAALDGGVAAGWVAADEVYGNDSAFRARLQARGVGFVLAVSCDWTMYELGAYSERQIRTEIIGDMTRSALARELWDTRRSYIASQLGELPAFHRMVDEEFRRAEAALMRDVTENSSSERSRPASR